MENNQDKKRTMDDEEERMQAARRVPFAELNQVHADFVMAMALQEQDRSLNHMVTSIESEDEEEEEEYSSEEENYDGTNFESQELEFLEGQDSNSEGEDMEEDDIDPDELSYEELIALGESIGEEKRGLPVAAIDKCLSSCQYKILLDKKSGIDKCVICQVEYKENESLVCLPCEHPYHSECISNWLQIKKNCPICSYEVSSSKTKDAC